MTSSVDTTARRRNIESILPLLPNQRALLLLRDLEPDDPGFLQVQFTLHGEVDLVRLRQAWEAAVDRHPSLRMSIRSRKEGEPLGVVWRSVDLPWEVLDWQAMSVADQ